MTQKPIPLTRSRAGVTIRIVSLPLGELRAQFIRVGIGEGERVECLERLPGGTVVIRKHRQQIAIGHQLAGQILVVVVAEERR